MKRGVVAAIVAGVGAVALGLLGATAQDRAKGFAGFKPPSGIELKEVDDAFGWMIRAEAREALDEQLLELEAAEARPDKDLMARIRAAIALEERSGGYNSVQSGYVGDDYFEVRGNRLYREDETRAIVDPRRASGIDYAVIDSWDASPDGWRIAVAINDGGTEMGTGRLYNLKTGVMEPDIVGPTIGGGPLVWVDDETLLVATPRTLDFVGDDPQRGIRWRVYKVGEGFKDTVLFAADEAGVAPDPTHIPGFWCDPASTPLLLAYFWNGSYSRYYWAERSEALAGKAVWRRVAADKDLVDVEPIGRNLIITAVDPDGEQTLYAFDTTTGKTRTLRRGDASLNFEFTVGVTDGAFIRARSGAYNRLFYLDKDLALNEVALPFEGVIDDESYSPVTLRPAELVFEMSRPDKPSHFVHVKRDKVTMDAKAEVEEDSILAGDKLAVRLEEAVSADGTKVPITIIEAGRTADSPPTRTILDAYGAYGEVTMTARDATITSWVALGGVYADCHVRGSSYYGAGWYRAGKAPDKSRAHQDVVACAEHLIRTGRTTPASLALQGASAGAMVVGPVGLSRPDLFGAVVIQSGYINPLRALEGVNGASDLEEMGDPRVPEVAVKLRASDTIEVMRTVANPPPLYVCAGMLDARVPYWMSARLIALYRERFPDKRLGVLIDPDGGHSCMDGVGGEEGWTRRFTWLWDVLKP